MAQSKAKKTTKQFLGLLKKSAKKIKEKHEKWVKREEAKKKMEERIAEIEERLAERIKETKCKCNSCGKVWHYLEEEEKRIKSQIRWSGFGMMTCCLPLQLYSKNEATKWQTALDKFRKCPECGSVNITKKEVYHEKQ